MSETPENNPPVAEPPTTEVSGMELEDGEEEEEQLVSIETVVAKDNKGIDYMKLIKQFGSEPISPEQIAQIEQLTGKKAHHFLRCGIFFSQRDLKFILAQKEQGKPFYLYTGRGPSSDAMHLGHLIPFLFTQYLQEAFNIPLVIQLTDDEKFLWKEYSLNHSSQIPRLM